MELERNPFVDTACADLAEGQVRDLTVADLLTITAEDAAETSADAAEADLDADQGDGTFRVTETFLLLWKNLPTSGAVNRATIASVMHGISMESRHPAFRVQPTGHPDTYQADIGDHVTLVFTRGDDTDAGQVWLAVLHHL